MSHNDRHQLEPLLRQALDGNNQALGELVVKLRPYLYVLARRHLGAGGNHAPQQDDVVSSSVRRILQHFGTLQGPSVPKFLAWVGTIVYNRSMTELRPQNTRVRPVSPEVLVNTAERLPWEKVVERDRAAVNVAQAIAKLPERKRQIVEMFFLDRLSDREICEKIGGSLAAIRVLRHRALKDLLALMQEEPS